MFTSQVCLDGFTNLNKYVDMSIPIEVLGLMVKQAQYRQHRALERRLAPLGVSLVQWNALREIHRYPGSSMHQLAELTFNSDQAFGTLVSRLMKMGLVARQPGAGRVITHTLTPSGQGVLDQCQQIVPEVVEKSFEPLSEADRQELHRLLTILLAK